MEKEKLWAIYLKKNPHWAKDGAHFTPDGVKKFVEQVWRQAYQEALAKTKVEVK